MKPCGKFPGGRAGENGRSIVQNYAALILEKESKRYSNGQLLTWHTSGNFLLGTAMIS